MTYSLIRRHEYEEISKIRLDGSILDLGGSKKSGYQELVQGEHIWTTVNIDEDYGCDLVFDIEKEFPLETASFDNVVTMNVLEHIFEYRNVFSETSRILKKNGLFVSSVPFMHHIHGSPDDYHRYTKSTYYKLADVHGFELIHIVPLGYGLFSLIYQTVGGWIPTDTLKRAVRSIAVGLDKSLLHFKRYQRLRDTIPLGYFWVMKRK